MASQPNKSKRKRWLLLLLLLLLAFGAAVVLMPEKKPEYTGPSIEVRQELSAEFADTTGNLVTWELPPPMLKPLDLRPDYLEQYNALGIGHKKLIIDPSMLVIENGIGAEKLFDEQQEAGEPVTGKGGEPVTAWFPGWDRYYPSTAYLDLKKIHQISVIYLRDVNDIGKFEIYTGSPDNCKLLVQDSLETFNTWKMHDVRTNTRYLRFVMRSGHARVAEVVLYGIANPADDSPPRAIADVRVSDPTHRTVLLSWTATGDDVDKGAASGYDIRFSTEPITEENFNDALEVTREHVPDVSGTPEQMVIGSLKPATKYYFAIKAHDDNYNYSDISNIASIETTPADTKHWGGPYATRKPLTVDEFIGLNIATDIPRELATPAGIVREYHPWGWDDGGDEYDEYGLKFNPSYFAKDWNFDKSYHLMAEQRIKISPVLFHRPLWMKTKQLDDKPTFPLNADATDPHAYERRSAYLFQFVARYGNTGVPLQYLRLHPSQDLHAGMNFIHYYEDWNEPDKTWLGRAAQFTPEEYAAMASADFDAHCRTLPNWETKGIKNADPDAKMVMGGVAYDAINYLDGIRKWSEANRPDKRLPFDVINAHHYSTTGPCCESPGISPEQDNLEQKLKDLVAWRNQYAPEKEVWVSEFGYGNSPGKQGYATPYGPFSTFEVQGMWALRSYLIGLAAGVDRMFYFMVRDGDLFDGNWDTAMGLTFYCDQFFGCNMEKFKAAGYTQYQKKPAWYHIKTLKTYLQGMVFEQELSANADNARILQFKHPVHGYTAYVAWKTTANNALEANYLLNIGEATAAKIVNFQGDRIPEPVDLRIKDSNIMFDFGEMPVIILTNGSTQKIQ